MKKETFKTKSLDDLNKGRVETTKRRVAHAFELAERAVLHFRLRDKNTDINNHIKAFCTEISHAVNLLESGVEEMTWACEHFDWNSSVCDQMNDAVKNFGSSLMFGIRFDPVTDESEEITFEVENGLIKLAKTLATLIRWFDDNADVSEV